MSIEMTSLTTQDFYGDNFSDHLTEVLARHTPEKPGHPCHCVIVTERGRVRHSKLLELLFFQYFQAFKGSGIYSINS